MASLESLSNALERTAVLPQAVNVRNAAGIIAWSPTIQYFINDLVTSSVNGGAYVYDGGLDKTTAILDGGDPSIRPDIWTRLTQNGVQDFKEFSLAAPVASLVGGGAYTLPAGATATVGANQTWLCGFSGSVSTAAFSTTSDFSTITWTPSVGTASLLTLNPTANAAATVTRFGSSVVVATGALATTITPTATGGAAVTTIAAGSRFYYIRLV